MIIDTCKINVINRFEIGGSNRFVLIAGPCAIESEEMTMMVAAKLKEICEELDIHLIFKSSFDKANRSSVKAPRGLGMKRGLEILQRVKTELDLPIVTDVHEAWQCAEVAKVADMLQIPAFLSRQTDLLVAAAQTGKIVNVKKGQFMAPWDMKNVIDKLRDSGNENILLCERGSSFGYNNLVVDMTGLVEMRSYGFPVVFDATHAVQKPGGQGTSTGGNREMVPYLMRAALAVGVDAIFAEVHPDPDHAFSDGPNQIHLSRIKEILEQAIAIDNITKQLAVSNKQQAVCAKIPTKNHQPIKIKLLLTDVDGVLTDAGMYYSEAGDELKKFNTHDGMGLQLIRDKGIKTGIITSEDTKLVERRFNKLKLDYLYQGKREGGKLASVKEICSKEGLKLSEVAYIGDDVNCFELLSNVGLAACPSNALDTIKNIPGIIQMKKKGGEGCVREFVEMIMNSYC
ncbi:2-dehydro-3-deoxyphosphooctonate aldolase [Paludibacter propionicigenes WB4]|uniref:2-dehydro-3-deoxyphosphooctonate aldolase n=1 Tax=Paludibacter propionicigenes (strain DSM 17365 / JCM 13257 / WB4) TaxID=694427 RepID=E4T532_PALPW|nr:3-deoxy-8-phosphooctulonate synthase [Paludibacter propionicigenes]ADQ79826.1 2-dehydro-3-deoxyphosphooctonate aldolase [Paludibacter propionicigenes WB4]